MRKKRRLLDVTEALGQFVELVLGDTEEKSLLKP